MSLIRFYILILHVKDITDTARYITDTVIENTETILYFNNTVNDNTGDTGVGYH